MKVKAKNHINYNGKWVTGGDVFEIADKDLDKVAEYVDVLKDKQSADFVSEIFKSEDNVEKVDAPKRGRRKKSED